MVSLFIRISKTIEPKQTRDAPIEIISEVVMLLGNAQQKCSYGLLVGGECHAIGQQLRH